MTPVQAPIDQLTALLDRGGHVGERVDFGVLDELGIFVLRNAFCAATVAKYRDTYFADLESEKLKKTTFHVTEVKVERDHLLTQIVREPEFLAVASAFFEGKVGSDFVRIVKKDAANRGAVFIHQDSCYQIGSLDRYSLFIALTDCGPHNGGLALYPGTHHFGYLGDAGEIGDVLPPGFPVVAPDLKAGDLIVMHSAVWHRSPESLSGADRVYLEVHVQPIDEPTTTIEICGERTSKWALRLKPEEIFVSSRTQRLRSLYQKIEALEAR
jgi:hypothetical protein